jgi:hypothetical protein
MRYAGGLGWPRLSGKTGEFSAGSMATRAGFRITHWQSRPSFAVYSGWTWRKTAFILPILVKKGMFHLLKKLIGQKNDCPLITNTIHIMRKPKKRLA